MHRGRRRMSARANGFRCRPRRWWSVSVVMPSGRRPVDRGRVGEGDAAVVWSGPGPRHAIGRIGRAGTTRRRPPPRRRCRRDPRRTNRRPRRRRDRGDQRRRTRAARRSTSGRNPTARPGRHAGQCGDLVVRRQLRRGALHVGRRHRDATAVDGRRGRRRDWGAAGWPHAAHSATQGRTRRRA